jgi:predicted amidohydrolase YtcJ
MAADLIVKATTIITMNDAQPRAEAIAIDTAAGTITAVGSLDDVQAAAPGATVTDLGSDVLMPGFIDAHSHPALGGMVTQSPAYWISPYMGYPTYADVQALWKKLDAELPAGQALLFNGLDRLLQGAPELTNTDLDAFFPSRPVVVIDNSGHEAYFNSATITLNAWADGKPPVDPVGARYGRNDDGTSSGRAYETAAVLGAAVKVLGQAVPHPLQSLARFFSLMSSNGVTMTTEHTYEGNLLKGYEACASVPESLVRVALYHMSIEADCGDKIAISAPADMLWKQGIKLWADGSPWVGTIASSFPYLDSPVVTNAQIPLGPGGEGMMNYTRAELDEILAKYAPLGWQFAFHVNGDVGLDVVLDAYEHALSTNGLLGTDHRWRVEHVGGCRGDQFDRAASLGVSISLLPAQFIYWGDLLDGQMFPAEIGSQWMRGGDAFRSGALVTFHNDGSVSPPIPLLNIQCMVTRRTPSGALHGPEQQVTLDDAFKAHTINAARQLFREKDLGSIEVGKRADLVQLSADPYTVDPDKLTEQVKVNGTWLNGAKTDPDAFLARITSIDPTEHQELATAAISHKC